MTSTITAEKAALRRRVRAYLEGLSPRQRRESDDALFARFLSLPQVEAADTLLLYPPCGPGGSGSACPGACPAMGWRPG